MNAPCNAVYCTPAEEVDLTDNNVSQRWCERQLIYATLQNSRREE